MFPIAYVQRFPVTPLVDVEIEGIRHILLKRGYVREYVETILPAEIIQVIDGGYSETTAILDSLRPAQLQWLRAWLKQAGVVGPGTAEVVGGEDGTQYSQPEEMEQAEIEICILVTGTRDPIAVGLTWGFGFS